MSNLFRALLLLGSSLASAAPAGACPSLEGAYLKIEDKSADRLLVVQDGCVSVTFLYDYNRKGFDTASPKFLVDGTWHRSASRAEYRAEFKGDELRVAWRSAARDVVASGFAWSRDGRGTLGQTVPQPDGKSTLTTYFEATTHHESPTGPVKIKSGTSGWRRVDAAAEPRLIPILDSVRRTLGALDRRVVYSCRMRSERAYGRENQGELVLDLSGCRPG